MDNAGCRRLRLLQIDRVKSKLAPLQHLAANRATHRTRIEKLPLVLRSARPAPEARRYPHDLQPATFGESAPSDDTEGKVECLRVDTRELAQEKPRRNNATAAILIGSAQSNLNHPLGYRYLVHSGLRAPGLRPISSTTMSTARAQAAFTGSFSRSPKVR